MIIQKSKSAIWCGCIKFSIINDCVACRCHDEKQLFTAFKSGFFAFCNYVYWSSTKHANHDFANICGLAPLQIRPLWHYVIRFLLPATRQQTIHVEPKHQDFLCIPVYEDRLKLSWGLFADCLMWSIRARSIFNIKIFERKLIMQFVSCLLW